MQKWEYCEVDFNGLVTRAWFYDEAGDYIDSPTEHRRLGIELAKLGNDGWKIISTWWRDRKRVTYMLIRPKEGNWEEGDRKKAEERYKENHPRG